MAAPIPISNHQADLTQQSVIERIRRRRRIAALWRDAMGPIIVTAGVAIVEQISNLWPALPEPAPLVLVAIAISGFLTSLNSAVLSSLIGVAYAVAFVAMRHDTHGGSTDICFEAIYLGVPAPFLAIMGALLRQHANKAAESLKKHLSNTPLGVIELREDYEVCLWGGAAENIFGLAPEQVVGKSLFELRGVFFAEEDSYQVRRLLDELERGKRNRAVLHTRREARNGGPSHSRWFWSTTLDTRGSQSRFLVLVEDINDRIQAEQALERSKAELIQRLVRAAEYRDEETGAHVVRMSRYCVALARASGMDEHQCEMLLHAAPMHDIGKLGVSDDVLLKKGKLTPEEYELMKRHTKIGADILSGSTNDLVQMAERIALTHHEHWDGSGYPRGLMGEEIPLVGRICAVCDVFDALTSDRPYKASWSIEEALNELKRLSGKQLDPNLVKTFISILPEIEAIRHEFVHPEDSIRRAA